MEIDLHRDERAAQRGPLYLPEVSDDLPEKLIPIGVSTLVSAVAAFLSGTYAFVRQTRDYKVQIAALDMRLSAAELKVATAENRAATAEQAIKQAKADHDIAMSQIRSSHTADVETAMMHLRNAHAAELEAAKLALLSALEKHRSDFEGGLDDIKEKTEKIRDSSSDFAKDAELAEFISKDNEWKLRLVEKLGRVDALLDRVLQESSQQRDDRPRRR
jgi:hypothetical protein